MRSGAPALVLLLGACSGIRIVTDFEGASGLARFDEDGIVVRVEGQADQDGRNRQASWYSFRVDGAEGRPLKIRLTDLKGEYNYKPGALAIKASTPAWTSPDGTTWTAHPLSGVSAEEGVGLLEVTPASDRFWIAHLEPYVASRLDRFRGELIGNPWWKEEVLGSSVEGRPIRLWTVTNPNVPEASKKVVWVMFRQHAWESGTSFVGEGLIRWLVSPEGLEARSRAVFKVFPMMDPDGCARGGVRFNRNGYDVNRNWDVVDESNARLMPEIAAAKRAMHAWAKSGRLTHLFLTLHNQEEGEWLSGSERHPGIARRLFDRLAADSTFSPGAQAGPRPPGKEKPAKGRYTVYEHLEAELGWPAFLLEQGVARSERLGRPATADDRRRFGKELAQVLVRVATEE
jgi:hypothetical protein